MLTEKLILSLCVFFMLSCDSRVEPIEVNECEGVYQKFSRWLPVNSGTITAIINGVSYSHNIDTLEFPIQYGRDVVSFQPCPSYTFNLKTDSLGFLCNDVKGLGEYILSTTNTDSSGKYKGHYLGGGGSAAVWGYYGSSEAGVYRTSNYHRGKVTITRLDSDSMLASGTFEFEAFDSIRMKSIKVTNGVFTDFRIIPVFF